MSTVAVAPECITIELDSDKESAKLNATFRCDRCSAQAYVLVTLHSNNQLAFCAHHAHQYRDALLPFASEWYSEESRLKEDRKKGSEN